MGGHWPGRAGSESLQRPRRPKLPLGPGPESKVAVTRWRGGALPTRPPVRETGPEVTAGPSPRRRPVTGGGPCLPRRPAPAAQFRVGTEPPGQGFLPRTHSRQGRGLARPPALHPGLLLAAGPAVALSAFPSGVTSLLLQGQPVCLGHRAYRHHGRLCPRGDAGRIFVLVTLLTNLGGTADVAKVTMATLAPSSGRRWPWPLAAPSFSPELARSAFLSPAHRKGGAE